MTRNKQILHGDQTMTSGNFSQARPRPVLAESFFVTHMLMRDLFAVANLLVLDGWTEN